MRIIAGRYKSRRLKAKPAKGIRPTSDKLRETLFNILGHRVIESVFLDAYAGVGAVGIEALSRGARTVHFVDRSREACKAIRGNISSLEVCEPYRILEMDSGDAFSLCRREGVVFDLVFLDPPYHREGLYERDLLRLGSESLLSARSMVIVEHLGSVNVSNEIPGLAHVRTHRQGDSALTFYQPESR
jgi:16S rRNA (guanine966-N2)-methyltransferase